MAICRFCKAEMDDKANKCPNCLREQRTPKWLIALMVIFAIGMFGTIITNFSEEEDNSGDDKGKITEQTNSTNNVEENKEKKTTVKKEKLELEDGHTGYLDSAGFAYYIEGYVKNNTDKQYRYVQISFNSYDSEGNTLGTCLDNLSGLEANGRWKFKAICLSDSESIASYKLQKISGY